MLVIIEELDLPTFRQLCESFIKLKGERLFIIEPGTNSDSMTTIEKLLSAVKLIWEL